LILHDEQVNQSEGFLHDQRVNHYLDFTWWASEPLGNFNNESEWTKPNYFL